MRTLGDARDGSDGRRHHVMWLESERAEALRQVERIAADAEAWIDSVAVPFLRDSAMPTLSDFTKRVETATENVTLAQAAAAAAGFVVAGPVGAAAGVAAAAMLAMAGARAWQ